MDWSQQQCFCSILESEVFKHTLRNGCILIIFCLVLEDRGNYSPIIALDYYSCTAANYLASRCWINLIHTDKLNKSLRIIWKMKFTHNVIRFKQKWKENIATTSSTEDCVYLHRYPLPLRTQMCTRTLRRWWNRSWDPLDSDSLTLHLGCRHCRVYHEGWTRTVLLTRQKTARLQELYVL